MFCFCIIVRVVKGVFVNVHRLPGRPAPGWRRQPPQALPSTPGTDVVDAPDFGMSRIKKKVLDTATCRDKRTVGIGAMGRLLRPSIQSVVFTKDLTMQLDEMEDHRWDIQHLKNFLISHFGGFVRMICFPFLFSWV